VLIKGPNTRKALPVMLLLSTIVLSTQLWMDNGCEVPVLHWHQPFFKFYSHSRWPVATGTTKHNPAERACAGPCQRGIKMQLDTLSLLTSSRNIPASQKRSLSKAAAPIETCVSFCSTNS
jgi:hypothetical protein